MGIMQMLLGSGGAAQAYWFTRTGGTADDFGYAVRIDGNGDIYAAGTTNATLYKFSADGALLWQRRLSGYAAYGLAVDGAGGVYICGSTAQSGGNAFVAKYNSSGTLQWQRVITLTGANSLALKAAATDGSNNVYVSGYYYTSFIQEQLLMKYDSAGTLLWQRIIGQSNTDDSAEGVAVDSSGNVYTGGFGASYDFFLTKYDTNGTLQWQQLIARTGSSQGTGVAVDSSANVYLVGYEYNSSNIQVVSVVKLNTSGTLQWSQTLSHASVYLSGLAVDVTDAGDVFITGIAASSAALVARYNTSGTLQWQRTFDGTSGTADIQAGYGIAVDSNSVVVAGSTNAFLYGGTDFLVLRLPLDGSRTGTYGTYVYAASSYTAASAGYTAAAGTATAATGGTTSSTGSLTASTPTNSTTKVDL
jgi:hypothetical protein